MLLSARCTPSSPSYSFGSLFMGYRNIIRQIEAVSEPLIKDRKKVLSKLGRDYRTEHNSHLLSTANFKRHSTGANATRMTDDTTDVS